jgi:hypothetical protein
MCCGSLLTSKASVASYLHAIGELVALQAGLELRIVLPAPKMLGIELLEQIELRPLFSGRGKSVTDILD